MIKSTALILIAAMAIYKYVPAKRVLCILCDATSVSGLPAMYLTRRV
jgi:hypothetical protein